MSRRGSERGLELKKVNIGCQMTLAEVMHLTNGSHCNNRKGCICGLNDQVIMRKTNDNTPPSHELS